MCVCGCVHLHIRVYQFSGAVAVPAEIQQGSRGAGDAIRWPAEQVELGQGTCLLGLHVLQVEAAHQEVFTPDVLRHQVHLRVTGLFSEKEENHLVLPHKNI